MRCAQTSAAKPHAVVVSSQQDLVLLAVEPDVLHAPGSVTQPTAAAATAGAAGAEAPTAPAVPTAEEFDANTRSLQQAVENLARFTSDQPAGAAQATQQNRHLAVGFPISGQPAVLHRLACRRVAQAHFTEVLAWRRKT